jgi:hypothetical protein
MSSTDQYFNLRHAYELAQQNWAKMQAFAGLLRSSLASLVKSIRYSDSNAGRVPTAMA